MTRVRTLSIALACCVARGVFGGTVAAPGSTSTTNDEVFGTATGNVVNQSGLSIGYVNDVDDFDDYLAANPTHNSQPESNVWLMTGAMGNFDMDFGAPVTVEAIAIWNKDGGFGVNGFNLLAADNPSFTGATTLVAGALTFQSNQPLVPHERFDFDATTARYFRIEILGNHGAGFTGLSELVFNGSAEIVTCPADLDGNSNVAFQDLLLLLAGWGPCPTGSIDAPAGTSTNIDEVFGTATDHVVDQSGLSTTYDPGVDNFDEYLAGNPTHNSGPEANVWLMTGSAGNFDMNFGAPVTVDAIAIWNKDGPFGVNAFNLLAADNPGFVGAVDLVSGNLSFQANQPAVPHQLFEFDEMTAQYFRIEIVGNHGAGFTGLSELAFGQQGAGCLGDIDLDGGVGFTDLLILLAGWGPCPTANPIDAPGGTSTTGDEAFGTATGNVVDQSGLTIGYVPGVDDFDAYIDMNPAHDGGPEDNVWITTGASGDFDMDFGAPVTVDAIAIWNKDGEFGVQDFNLLAADNPAFTGAVTLVTSSMKQQPSNPIPTPVERFDFTVVTAHYFRIEILSNHGAGFTGLGEVALRLSQ